VALQETPPGGPRSSGISYQELLGADEIFSTGNLGKVLPVTRIDDRDLQPGPVYARARELYWDWSHGG
jgi:branched-chain amino acid aminotransferase